MNLLEETSCLHVGVCVSPLIVYTEDNTSELTEPPAKRRKTRTWLLLDTFSTREEVCQALPSDHHWGLQQHGLGFELYHCSEVKTHATFPML